MKKWKLIIPILIIIVIAFAYLNRQSIYYLVVKVYKIIIKDNCTLPSPLLPTGDTCWGIDLSHHQPHINWDKLIEKNRPDFIFFKATEGSTHKDSKYAKHAKKSRQMGIPTGAYHFFSYQSSGKTQAKFFIKEAKLMPGDLFPVLDVEYQRSMKPKKWIVKEIKAFSDIIHAEFGVYPIIYCSCGYYENYLKEAFSHYTFWIADYYRKPACNYAFWQYTDKGLVHGIGKVDNNRLKKGLKLEDFIIK